MAGLPYVDDVDLVTRALKLVRTGTMPGEVTTKHLAANGFNGNRAHRVLGFLRAMGFVAPSGTPTTTWVGYRESDDPGEILGAAVRAAYAPLFTDGDPVTASNERLADLVQQVGGLPPDMSGAVVSTFRALTTMSSFSVTAASPEARDRHDVMKDVAQLLQSSVSEFETARQCFQADLLRPAHVAAWSSYAAIAFAHLSDDDFVALRTSPRRQQLGAPTLMRGVFGAELIETLVASGLVGPDDRAVLEALLRQRNDCAHPVPYEPTREDTADYLSRILGQAAALTAHPLV